MPTVTVIQPRVADDTNRLLRVAAYCRVSSSSDDQLNSYNSQLTYYSHKFEDSETETLIDIYADEGITGTCEEKRTEFLRLINDCRKGKIDRVYTKSISRFARNTRDCLKNIRELKSLGITIMFEKESIDTANITDELMITIMGGLAQEESTSISQNLKWSIRRKMKNGDYTPHSAAYGYAIKEKKLSVDEQKSKIVRDIFSYFINGHGTQSTTEYINSKYNIEPPIAMSTVRYILTNEKYIGDTLHQKTFTPDMIGVHHRDNKGELDKYYVENTHDAIIKREYFNIAQKLMNDRNIKRKPHNKNSLYKKIKCGLCGRQFILKNKFQDSYWICIMHIKKVSLCNSPIVRNYIIKNAFIKIFNTLYSNNHHIILPLKMFIQELVNKQKNSNKSIIELRRNTFQLKEQLKVIATLHTKGFLNEAKFKEQSLEMNNKIDKLSKDIRLLSQSDDIALKQIEMLIDYFEKRSNLMIEFEPQAFDFLIDKIVVNDNILEFHIKGGLVFTEEI